MHLNTCKYLSACFFWLASNLFLCLPFRWAVDHQWAWQRTAIKLATRGVRRFVWWRVASQDRSTMGLCTVSSSCNRGALAYTSWNREPLQLGCWESWKQPMQGCNWSKTERRSQRSLQSGWSFQRLEVTILSWEVLWGSLQLYGVLTVTYICFILQRVTLLQSVPETISSVYGNWKGMESQKGWAEDWRSATLWIHHWFLQQHQG